MRVRKILFALFVLLITVVACSPAPVEQGVQTSSAVQANPILFDGLLIALFTAGTIYLFEKFGLDLRQFAVPVAVTISAFLVGLVQNWINVQPVEFDPWIAIGLRVLETLLAGFGVLRLFSRQPATLLQK